MNKEMGRSRFTTRTINVFGLSIKKDPFGVFNGFGTSPSDFKTQFLMGLACSKCVLNTILIYGA